jgi:hypothetical protein
MQQKTKLLLLFIYLFQNMSKFRDWQETRKEISLQRLEELHPGASDTFGYDEAPPEKIFEYEGDCWISQQNDGDGSYFWTFIERDDYASEDIEMLEMRLFLWVNGYGHSF